MNTKERLSLFVLRVVLGWMYFWAGFTKVTNPDWSAAGYLTHATNFSSLYAWFASPNILPIVNLVNAWGLTLLGVSLITGAFIRFSAPLGMLLMLLYYSATGFPIVDDHTWLVEEHVVYAASLLALWIFQAGRVWGLGNRFK